MRELVTIAAAFLIVVGLALFMFISNDRHSISIKENFQLNEVVENQKKDIETLRSELDALREHTYRMDSLYHKRNMD